MKHGYGIMYYDGMEFEGEFKNDEFHGKGVIRFPNGDVYKGQIQNHREHGYGFMYFEEKNLRLFGYFEDGQINFDKMMPIGFTPFKNDTENEFHKN